MRISDWSSDVCSSDLAVAQPFQRRRRRAVDHRADRAGAPAAFHQRLRLRLRPAHHLRQLLPDLRLFRDPRRHARRGGSLARLLAAARRSEEPTSELQSLMRISYAVFCLKKNKKNNTTN